MSSFLTSHYKTLTPYVPGEQPRDMEYIKLNTNESPYPPSPQVIERITRTEVEKLRLYSDPECKMLKEKLANIFGKKSENIFLANGSDDILNFAFMIFCSNETKTVFPDITYGFYKVFAQLHKVDYTEIPLEEDFSIDHKKYCGIGKNIFIANPNAPTGLCLSLDKIEEILVTNPENLVVIDEAYVDFGGESAIKLVEKHKNLLVVGTFSKSRSLAGGRLGFAVADESIIKDLETVRYSTNPYNINRLTMIAGEASCDDNDYYMQNCQKIIRTRSFVTEELEKLGFSVIPSKANFVFAKHKNISGEEIYTELKKRGVLVRHFTGARISDFNRITIGTEEEMKKMLEALGDIIAERKEKI